MLLISKRRQFNKEIFALLMLLSFFTVRHSANAQNGYIYVHSKTLDESSSPNITYSVAGGPTVVPSFSLNDMPAQIQLADIGSSQNGRLWAVGEFDHVLYYRNVGTANWVATTVTDAARVDGGSAGTAYYVTTGGVVNSHDGTTSTTISGAISAVDIGSGWDNQPYATNSSGDIIRYSGAGTIWNAFFNNAETLVNVDVSPSDGYVYATSSSSVEAFRISPAGVGVSMSKPTDVASNIVLYDIATDALGNVFAIGFSTPGSNRFVYKWISGTSWSSREVTTNQVSIITGGLGGQMWGINRLSWDVAGYPYHNIFTRALDGTSNWWIDDERVRTSVTNGNSEMIAVAPGTYTITETVPGGWDLQKITIYDPSSNSTSNLGAHTATLTVASNEVVHVIFQSGIVNPFAITADCSIIYTENFGTGAIGTFGPAFVGSTSYHYLNNSTPGEDGYYKIVSSGSDMNSWSQAAGFLDHTTDAAGSTGRMLAVNASYDQNEFFRRRLTGLIPGADYQFSAWIANLTPGAPIDPNVSFQIIDPTSYSVIASNTTGDLTGATTTWTQYKLTFTATTSQIDLVLVNNNIGGSGNDLAIDDISFQVSPPDDPTTTVVNASCSGNGSITITSPLGASYEYSINGTTYQSSPAFTNLPGGTYTVYTRFATKPLCVSTKVDKINIGICGSVWNDADGSVTQNGSETGTNTGGTIYVNLVNSSGTVVASTTVSASGSYSLTAPASTTGLKLVLTNTATSSTPGTLPTGWVNTGEIAGAGNTATQSTTLGQIELTTSTSAVTGSNFGIEKLPTPGSGTATVTNSGGTSAVTAPPSAFTNVTPSTDTAPGSVTAIHITTFPSNVTSLTINGTTYTAGTFPAGGVIVPTTSTGAPTVPILVDPTNDANPVVFTYKAVDNAGKESTNTGTATLTPTLITLSGQVWNDADGSLTQNGSETGTNAGGPLYVNLVNGTGTVIGSTTVSASGAYSLTGVPANTTGLKLVLASIPTSNTPGTLPTGWINTGENVGATNSATQSTSLGQIELTTGAGAVTAQNFGIEVLPTPGSGTATVTNSGGTNAVTTPPGAFTNVTPSTDTAPGSVTAIHITSFPSNVTSLTINGTTYTAGTFPAGGVIVPTTSTGAPTVPILVDPTNDANPVVFTYKAVDNAGKESTTTGTATLNFPGVPDLTPIIYARPQTLYGTTNITYVVDVLELKGVTTSGLITVKVTKDALTSLTFPTSATSVGGKPVQNSLWTFDGDSDEDVYIFTTTAPVPGGNRLTFGMVGVMTPGASTGTLTASVVIVGGSGGEVRTNNNVDADKIDYFQQ